MVLSVVASENCAIDSIMKKQGYEKQLKPAEDLALSLRDKLTDDYVLTRWNGVRGTVDDHANWMLDNIKSLCDSSAFRPYGSIHGITYEIHDNLTKESDGDGLFRLRGVVDIPADVIVAMVLDPITRGLLDYTMMYINCVHRYTDQKTKLCIWIAEPGFPFQWRDGLDISTWTMDDSGVYWQYALSVPSEMPVLSEFATRAVTKYWGYKLEPVKEGKGTAITLVCQSALNGYIPKMAVNWKIGDVLSEYIRKVEKTGKSMVAQGTDRSFVTKVLFEQGSLN